MANLKDVVSEETINRMKEVSSRKDAKEVKEGKVNGIPVQALKFPEHIIRVMLIIKNNAEIRRFTALNFIQALKDAGEIKPEDTAYVDFGYNDWTRFTLVVNKWRRRYELTNEVFVKAFIAALNDVTAASFDTIKNMCLKEGIKLEFKDE